MINLLKKDFVNIWQYHKDTRLKGCHRLIQRQEVDFFFVNTLYYVRMYMLYVCNRYILYYVHTHARDVYIFIVIGSYIVANFTAPSTVEVKHSSVAL